MSYQRVSRLPNYIKAFGWLDGIRLVLAIERPLPQTSQTSRPFRVPGHPSPLWLRDCVSDHAIFWQCIVRQQYRLDQFPHTAQLQARYQALLERGRTPLIIDGGGNIGLSAITLADAFPRARVMVIEPDAENFKMLLKNVEPYGERIQPLLGAVWHRDQQLTIVNPEAGASGFRVEAVGPVGTVQAHTIESLMRMAGEDEVLIVKLDIEGAQKALFAENTGWIATAGAVMLELDDWLFPWGGSSTPFFRAMSQHEFEYLLNGENVVCFNAKLAP